MIPSHVGFVADIANLLAKHGHEVTVIDNKLRSDISNRLDASKVRIITVEPAENVKSTLAKSEIPSKFWRMSNTPAEQKQVMSKLGEVFLEQCKHLVLQTTVLTELENVEFDFGMHEVFDVCGIGIFEALKIRRSVVLSSTGMRDIVSEVLGVAGPIWESSILSDYGSKVPLLWIRRNLQFHSAWRHFFEVQSVPLQGVFKLKHDFEELLRYSNLMFLNTHELSDCSRSWARRVFEIAGVSFKEPKELEEEYKQIISKFSQTVLISFGTTTPSFLMPEDWKSAILKAISKFPDVLFIWKYEKDDDFVKECEGKNVVFKKFIPQVDLLASGKISLFITHGGQNSLLEAFHSNTRLLIIPLFGDQHRNAQLALENNLANVLRKEDLSDWEHIEAAIRVGLQSDKRMEVNLKRTSSNLQHAKRRSETRLITSIEETFSSDHPPNFQSSPRFYTSDVTLTLLNGLLLTIVTLMLTIGIRSFLMR